MIDQISQLRREALWLRIQCAFFVVVLVISAGATVAVLGYAIQLGTHSNNYAIMFGILGCCGIGVITLGSNAIATNLALLHDIERTSFRLRQEEKR